MCETAPNIPAYPFLPKTAQSPLLVPHYGSELDMGFVMVVQVQDDEVVLNGGWKKRDHGWKRQFSTYLFNLF